jgi:hypothetical protein
MNSSQATRRGLLTLSRRAAATIRHDRFSPTPMMISLERGEISSMIYYEVRGMLARERCGVLGDGKGGGLKIQLT